MRGLIVEKSTKKIIASRGDSARPKPISAAISITESHIISLTLPIFRKTREINRNANTERAAAIVKSDPIVSGLTNFSR